MTKPNCHNRPDYLETVTAPARRGHYVRLGLCGV